MDKNKAIIHKDRVEIIVTSPVLGVHSVFVNLFDYENVLFGKNIHVIKGKRTFYAVMNVYYNGKSRPRAIHREIMGNPDCEVDHIDENGLNNCRDNLRFANRSQNGANISLLTNNKSGFKGVSYNKKANKWESYITVLGKRIYGGLFNTAQEAARNYDVLSQKHFGQFAKGNGMDSTIIPKKSINKSQTTGYKGVYEVKRKTIIVYQAVLWINSKKKHIGFYKSPEEAAFAYNEVAIKYQKDKAYVNIIKMP